MIGSSNTLGICSILLIGLSQIQIIAHAMTTESPMQPAPPSIEFLPSDGNDQDGTMPESNMVDMSELGEMDKSDMDNMDTEHGNMTDVNTGMTEIDPMMHDDDLSMLVTEAIAMNNRTMIDENGIDTGIEISGDSPNTFPEEVFGMQMDEAIVSRIIISMYEIPRWCIYFKLDTRTADHNLL